MRRCPECGINIGQPDTHCPLCGAELVPLTEKTGEERIYPKFTPPGKRPSRFPFPAKIFAFISLIGIFVCVLINLLISARFTWSLYVIGGIAVGWITVGLPLLRRVNPNTVLLLDLCAVSLYLMLIDHLTGWHRWSIDYVVPILYIGVMIATVILALIFRMYWREYILTLLAACVLGIGPLLIFFSSQSAIRYLCLAAALLAAALMIGILFFAGGKFFSEWKRRMNI